MADPSQNNQSNQKDSNGLRAICVATDFSENSSLALDRALELAAHHGARVALVHIVVPEIPPVAGPEVMMMPPDFEQRLEEAARAGLEKWAGKVREARIEVEQIVEWGSAASGVMPDPDERGPDRRAPPAGRVVGPTARPRSGPGRPLPVHRA